MPIVSLDILSTGADCSVLPGRRPVTGGRRGVTRWRTDMTGMTYREAALANGKSPFETCDYVFTVLSGRDDNALTPGERIFRLTREMNSLVCGDGFDAYFAYTPPRRIRDTLTCLRAAGAERTAGFLTRALAILELPEAIPDDYAHAASSDQRAGLDALDREYYAAGLEDAEIYPCLCQYLRQHPDEFT